MEYFVAVTRDCNLDCLFCFWKDLEEKSKYPQFTSSDIKHFVYLNRNSSNKSDIIVFYGGEPLLNQPFIEEIIHAIESDKVTFCLYTNGILLHEIKNAILNKLSYIIISIDGDEYINDKYKGSGSFKEVIRNVLALRKHYHGELIARFTLMYDSSLKNSVLGLIHYFDHVYWQIESSPRLEGWNEQIVRYDQDLDWLIDFWLANIEKGHFFNIVPFQCILLTLLWKRKVNSLRCGCGTCFVFIDTDGKCYSCDELVGYQRFHLGNVHQKYKLINACDSMYKIPLCDKCSIKDICGGRCISTHIKYPLEKFQFYCNNTMILVNKMQKIVPKIRYLIKSNGYSRKYFETVVTSHILEGIP